MFKRFVPALVISAMALLGLGAVPAGAQPFCIDTGGHPGPGITICTPG